MVRQNLLPLLLGWLQRVRLWKLWLLMVAVAMAMTELIVSVMGLLLLGKVTYDYLLTGMVASFLAASAVSGIILYFTGQLRKLNSELSASEDRLRLAASVFECSHEGTPVGNGGGFCLQVSHRASPTISW